jgi:DNA-binding MarR family transcriptional regulator
MSPPDTKAAEAAEKFARIETAILDPRCSPLMVAVLVTLSNYANRKRVAWPSYETMAFITGAAVQNVRIAVEKLEALGYIVVERDNQPGRSKVNRYTLQAPRCAAPIRALREALDQHRTTEKQARQHSPCGGEKQARQRAKAARKRILSGMLAYPDPSDDPSDDPGSATNVAADAVAPALPLRGWKGSEGEPIPAGFPDEQAMRKAESWAQLAGVRLDLKAVRQAFLNHHYRVRCCLTDWDQSWERWVEQAIDQKAA